MKRKAQAPPLPLSKRVKRDFSGIFDDAASEVCFADIKKLDWKAETRLEYVCGSVNGIQDVKGGGKRIILKSIDKSDSLEIQFVGRAFKGLVEASDDGTFMLKSGSHLMIALRGAEVLPMAFNKQIPNCIKLSEGVMLKILKSKYPGQEGKVVDTWLEDESNWFGTSSSEAVIETPPTPAASSPAPSRAPSPDNAMDVDAGVNKKTLAKQLRAKSYNEKKALRQSTPVATSEARQQPMTPRSTIKPLMSSQKQNEPLLPIPPAPLPIQPAYWPVQKPALNLENGLETNKASYIPLSSINPHTPRFNVIGVVCANSSPFATDKGDWKITFDLTDPSLFLRDAYGSLPPASPKFHLLKKLGTSLPQVVAGDVIILRNMKMCKSHPFGFHDQMSWALYPHRDLPSPSNHPSDTLLGRTTFYEPLPVELEYCKQLADWWAARQPRGNVNFTPTIPVDPIIPTPTTSYARSWSRQQRLISDATPDCEPQGYFDATVELLNKYDEYDVTNLYVTDYTINAQLYPVDTNRSSWCPEGLRDRVLRIEATHQAHIFARSMEVGKIYALDNLRMKVAGSGYLEGRLQERKIRVLDEADGAHNVHIKNFLIRRDLWREESEARKCQESRGTRAEPTTAPPQPRTSMCNLSDAAWDRLFSCVVEVISLNVNERTLYVSDYTHSKILISATEVGGMAGYVLPIRLNEDGHLDDAQGLNTGDFCLVENVKLKNNQAGNARGYLRRVDKCPITKVAPGGPFKVNVDKLIARKEKRSNGKENLKAKVVPPKAVKVEKPAPETTSKPSPVTAGKSTPATTSKPSPTIPSPAPILPPDASTYIETDIQNLMHHAPCPGKYRVTARLILISHKLREAVLSVCDNCSNPIPSNRKACVACNDDRHEFVRRMFRFGLLLGYEGNNQLVVFLDGESAILGGLRCVDLREDGDAYEAFRGRMRPMMGERWGSGNGEEEDAPTGTYFVKVRCNADGERKFFLQAFVPL